jgi:hypothetical protein
MVKLKRHATLRLDSLNSENSNKLEDEIHENFNKK